MVVPVQDAGAGDVTVVAGGVIPPADYDMLYKAGVKAIFGPGTKVSVCVRPWTLRLLAYDYWYTYEAIEAIHRTELDTCTLP